MAPPILQIAALLFLQASSLAYARPTNDAARSEPDPSLAVSVQLAGQTFINKASAGQAALSLRHLSNVFYGRVTLLP